MIYTIVLALSLCGTAKVCPACPRNERGNIKRGNVVYKGYRYLKGKGPKPLSRFPLTKKRL